MAEMKKYLDNVALGTLVDQIKAEDAKALQAAKDYSDGLAKNYDAAGSAATAKSEAIAEAEAKVNALAEGQVKLNKEAIEKLDGADTVEGSVKAQIKAAKEALETDIDAVEAIANKNKEDIAAINNAETGILKQAKDYTDAEVAEVQGAIDTLNTKVGDIPEGATATTVIGYIQEKTANIASDETVEGIDTRLTQAEADIANIEKDYLKAADKTELEGKINDKADQTSLDEVAAVANAAATKVALEAEVKRATDEEVRIEGLVTAEAAKAREEEGKLNERLVEVETFFKTAEDETIDQAMDTLVEIQKYITEDGAAADQMVKDIAANAKAIADHTAIDHDFAGADATLKAELEVEIDKKADKTTVEGIDGRVTTAEGKITAVEGRVDTAEGKITALEAKFGEGEGSVADMIADAVAVETEAREAADTQVLEDAAADAKSKADKALEDAKAYTDTEVAKDRERLGVLETASANHALKSEVEGVSGRVGTLETEMDAVELKAANNETAIGTINTELAKKAAQADLEAAVARVAQNETDIAGLKTDVADKAEQDDLDAAVERIAANEEAIAANTSAINSFTAITPEEVNALFA